MVSPEKGKNAMQMVALLNEAVPVPIPCGGIIKHFDKLSKPILDAEFCRKLERKK